MLVSLSLLFAGTSSMPVDSSLWVPGLSLVPRVLQPRVRRPDLLSRGSGQQATGLGRTARGLRVTLLVPEPADIRPGQIPTYWSQVVSDLGPRIAGPSLRMRGPSTQAANPGNLARDLARERRAPDT